MRGRVLVPAGRPLFVVLFAVIAGTRAFLLRGGRALGIAVLPEGFGQGQVATGLTEPTAMALAPDGNRISRFTAAGDVAVAGSERQIFNLGNLGADPQDPVDLQTGSDGSLYVLDRGSGSVTAIKNGG